MKILLLGPPGAGKGTQAKILSEILGIESYSIGSLLRQKAKEKNPEGKKAKNLIDKNQLGYANFIFKILKSHLNKKNFILDGFPRNMEQLNFSEKNLTFDNIFLLKIPEKESKKRLLSRKICEKCGKVYGKYGAIPKIKDKCDLCRCKLQTRGDDNEGAIEKRLKVYHNETVPIIYHFKKQGILKVIDGERTILEVTRSLFKKLEI